jgi:hypothetical protein
VRYDTRDFPAFIPASLKKVRHHLQEDASPVPLENTIAGYLPLPGHEVEEDFIRMIGADKFRPAPEPLEPDCFLAAPVTSHLSGHDCLFFLAGI